MEIDSDSPYRVEAQESRFIVLDSLGQVVMLCGDEPNAQQYAVLLNQAFRKGYKAGYRAGKEAKGKS